jgi:hypothetical protein
MLDGRKLLARGERPSFDQHSFMFAEQPLAFRAGLANRGGRLGPLHPVLPLAALQPPDDFYPLPIEFACHLMVVVCRRPRWLSGSYRARFRGDWGAIGDVRDNYLPEVAALVRAQVPSRAR